MKLFTYLSELTIPFFLFYVVGYGLLAKRDIYGDFLDGAKDGLKTAAGIAPALIGLMTGVGVLRASGFLDFLCALLGNVFGKIGFSPQLMPLTVVRLFSSSAAVGLLLDIFKKYGADSLLGFTASLILGSTESVFYCMTVYFGYVKIKKTRYTLPGALLAALAGVLASVYLGRYFLISP